jgi:hypothetical protein
LRDFPIIPPRYSGELCCVSTIEVWAMFVPSF